MRNADSMGIGKFQVLEDFMLIRTVENFLARHGMSASQFGRDAAQDPRLVNDMRAGRAPRAPLDQRLRGFMDGFELACREPLPPAPTRQLEAHSENPRAR